MAVDIIMNRSVPLLKYQYTTKTLRDGVDHKDVQINFTCILEFSLLITLRKSRNSSFYKHVHPMQHFLGRRVLVVRWAHLGGNAGF